MGFSYRQAFIILVICVILSSAGKKKTKQSGERKSGSGAPRINFKDQGIDLGRECKCGNNEILECLSCKGKSKKECQDSAKYEKCKPGETCSTSMTVDTKSGLAMVVGCEDAKKCKDDAKKRKLQQCSKANGNKCKTCGFGSFKCGFTSGSAKFDGKASAKAMSGGTGPSSDNKSRSRASVHSSNLPSKGKGFRDGNKDFSRVCDCRGEDLSCYTCSGECKNGAFKQCKAGEVCTTEMTRNKFTKKLQISRKCQAENICKATAKSMTSCSRADNDLSCKECGTGRFQCRPGTGASTGGRVGGNASARHRDGTGSISSDSSNNGHSAGTSNSSEEKKKNGISGGRGGTSSDSSKNGHSTGTSSSSEENNKSGGKFDPRSRSRSRSRSRLRPYASASVSLRNNIGKSVGQCPAGTVLKCLTCNGKSKESCLQDGNYDECTASEACYARLSRRVVSNSYRRYARSFGNIFSNLISKLKGGADRFDGHSPFHSFKDKHSFRYESILHSGCRPRSQCRSSSRGHSSNYCRCCASNLVNYCRDGFHVRCASSCNSNKCLKCSGLSSRDECVRRNITESCNSQNPVCEEEYVFDTISKEMAYSSGCASSEECAVQDDVFPDSMRSGNMVVTRQCSQVINTCENVPVRDFCDSKPCKHGACISGVSSYQCLCVNGWNGRDCDKSACSDPACNPATEKCQETFNDDGQVTDAQCVCNEAGSQGVCGTGCENLDSYRCFLYGDPHKQTFDKLKIHFQGTCRYIVSKTKQSCTLQAYKVTAVFENRNNNPRVSYVKQVTLMVNGVSITIGKGRSFVTVDGVKKSPGDVIKAGDQTITITLYRGYLIKLVTSFGVTVEYDGRHRAAVTIPPEYCSQVEGLCGNANGRRSDDAVTRNGKAISLNREGYTELGDSWKTDSTDVNGCRPTSDESVLPSTPSDECSAVFEDEDTSKALFDCAAMVDEETLSGILEACSIDVENGDDKHLAVCQNFEAFAQQCQERYNVDVTGWRADLNCSLECPIDMEYSSSISPCPCAVDSCEPYDPPRDGCVCPAGKMFSGSGCVDCVCTDMNGLPRQVGDKWLSEDCKQSFECNGNLKIEQQPNDCNEDEVCVLGDNTGKCIKGECVPRCKASEKCVVVKKENIEPYTECQCEENKLTACGTRCDDPEKLVCRAFGDVHIMTFDLERLDYQGVCLINYVTVKKSSSLQKFKVYVSQVFRGINKKVSWVDEITIHYAGLTIVMKQGRKVFVNGKKVKLPYKKNVGGEDIEIKLFRNRIVWFWSSSLEVKHDGRYKLWIMVPPEYCGELEGICGNANGVKDDDWTTSDGVNVKNSRRRNSKLGNSFAVGSTEDCTLPDEDVIMPPFTPEECKPLKSNYPNNPLQPCFKILGEIITTSIELLCRYDVEQYDDIDERQDIACEYFRTFVKMCIENNGKPEVDWLSILGCAPDCPVGMDFSSNAPSCAPTCANKNPSCSDPPGEGCVCPEDKPYTLGLTCTDQCQCVMGENMYDIGEIWFDTNCNTQFTCSENLESLSVIASCSNDEVCSVSSTGSGSCVKDRCFTSACESNGGSCIKVGNAFECNCPLGFSGDECENNKDDCDPNPCQNGGECADGVNSYTCTCKRGFTGDDCEENKDDCDPNPCQNGGECADGVNSYTCTCKRGFTGDDCEENKDDCDPNPCQNGGECADGVNSYTCTCKRGFTGDDCEENKDDCDPNPCQNGGECADGVNSYTCTCKRGFTGDDCEENKDDCDPNPCQNGGECADGVNSYTCTCKRGFTGDDCEENKDDCDPNPCQNGGECADGVNSYTCTCKRGFTGDDCEENKDDCDPNPCQNGGECADGVNSYTCTCKRGFTGDDCEENKDDCDPNPCQNGGECADGVNSYTCTCKRGFTGDDCEENKDDCDPNPCQNGGECADGVNSYTCTCKRGFTGDDCEENKDDCDPNPCQNDGECADGVNSYTCTCKRGFTGDDCEENKDDCDPNPCQNDGECADGVNSYTCTCKPGFTGDDCEENKDDCDPNPCQNDGECADGVNSYTCTCKPGFTGDDCEENINECKSNPCENGGTCKDKINDFSCTCANGFIGKTCDTPECRPSCSTGEKCQKVVSSDGHVAGKCVCKSGSQNKCGTGCNNPELLECNLFGDPHVHTSSGAEFDFQGNCKYTLARTKSQTDLIRFEVVAEAEHRRGNLRVSYVKSMTIYIGGFEIVFDKGGKVTVFHKTLQTVTLPYTVVKSNKLTVKLSMENGNEMTLRASNGLVVKYDGFHKASISIDPAYCDQLVGICGRWNGNRNDDFTTQDSIDVGRDPNRGSLLGKSWEHPSSPESCQNPSKDIVIPNDTPFECDYLDITNEDFSPFTQCFDVLPVSVVNFFLRSCIVDVSQEDDNNKEAAACRVMESFVAVCLNNDQSNNLEHWRSEANCPKNCPNNMIYSSFATACPATCKNQNPSCSNTVEDCECPSSLPILDRSSCIKADQCRCTDENTFAVHEIGDTWYSAACDTKFKCLASTEIKETSESCGTGKFCVNINGEGSCVDDPCFSSPCENGGTCERSYKGNAICHCRAQWTGERCDIDVNECAMNNGNGLCLQGSTCVNLPGDFECTCRLGFEGRLCQTNIDDCASEPCPRQTSFACVDSVNSYSCVCIANYFGQNCTVEKDNCIGQNCAGRGTCQSLEGDNYNCVCNDGWKGQDCETDINECTDGTPCAVGATCRNTDGSFVCDCPPDRIGRYCTTSPCSNGGKCVHGECRVVPGGSECDCKADYTGPTCEIEIKEDCETNCVNGNCQGGQICICDPGWDGENCDEDFNECASQPCIHGFCKNKPDGQGYECQCHTGYTGTNCENIAECTVSNSIVLGESDTDLISVSITGPSSDGLNAMDAMSTDPNKCLTIGKDDVVIFEFSSEISLVKYVFRIKGADSVTVEAFDKNDKKKYSSGLLQVNSSTFKEISEVVVPAATNIKKLKITFDLGSYSAACIQSGTVNKCRDL